MAVEERSRSGHIGPLSEALAPPLIVLRDGMVLRQIEYDESRRHIAHIWEPRTENRPGMSAGYESISIGVLLSPAPGIGRESPLDHFQRGPSRTMGGVLERKWKILARS